MCRFFLIIVLLLSFGCHETQKKNATRPTQQVKTKSNSTDNEPLETRVELAFQQANDLSERARILSVPVVPLETSRIQGIALPLYPELPDVRWEENLKWIAESGASAVSLVVSWDQRTIHHNRIKPDKTTVPEDGRVAEVIREAKRLNLKVMMFPILHVKLRNEGEWRGKLKPTDSKRWKEDYVAYIMHYAKISQENGVDVFSVGSELSSMERDEAFWEQTIATVRGTFKGKLIYSANWDHYEVPKFWDKLDYIGVSAYFEVAKKQNEPMFIVSDRWRVHRDRIMKYAAKQNRPVILTEVGYPSIDSAATKPWDYTAKTPPNQNAQLAAFQSLAQTWSEEQSDSFGGLFIWHGWGAGGPQDLSYAFWNKHAHSLVKDWYQR